MSLCCALLTLHDTVITIATHVLDYRSDEDCQQALAHACRLACLPREGLERALTEKTIEIGARQVTLMLNT
jgi:hypothetical protein